MNKNQKIAIAHLLGALLVSSPLPTQSPHQPASFFSISRKVCLQLSIIHCTTKVPTTARLPNKIQDPVKFGFQINEQYFFCMSICLVQYLRNVYLAGHSIFSFVKSVNQTLLSHISQLFINPEEGKKRQSTVFHKFRFSSIGTGKERQDRLDDKMAHYQLTCIP